MILATVVALSEKLPLLSVSANGESMSRNRVTYFKERESGVKTVCKIWDDIKKEGKIEERVNCVCAIMTSSNVSLEKAMEMLLIPEPEKDELRKLVELRRNDSNLGQKEKSDE